MERLHIFSLIIVSVVALTGILFYLQSERTGLAYYHDCLRYASEHDIVSPIYPTRQLALLNKPGFSLQEMNHFNLCSGEESSGLAVYMSRQPPLENHHRFEWYSGDVYAWSGGPDPRIGYIQYWICADGRARVIISGIEICNSLNQS